MGRIFCGAAVGGRYGVNSQNMQLVAAARIERVEIPFIARFFDYRDPAVLAGAAADLARAGVQCRSVHLGFDADYDISSDDEASRRATLDDMKHALAVAPLLGAKIAVVHGSSEPIADSQRPLRARIMRESLAELAGAASQNSLRIALELLPRTCLGNTVAEALMAVDGLDPAVAGFCLDVNHVNLREDPAAAVRRLADRIVTFHVSDNDGVDERHWFPFEGVVDWKAFMDAVREVDYEGQFIFETGGSLGDDTAGYLCELRARFDRLMAL